MPKPSASGDDDDTDDDLDAFIAPIGQSYYWSEIMGLKTFDNQSSFNSPNERISNIWAVNLGTNFKPTAKWTIEGDVWYAQTVEDVTTWDGKQDDKLGFELDLAATYEIFDNMNIRFVAAYLFADDATGDDDPWLLGTQLEFSF